MSHLNRIRDQRGKKNCWHETSSHCITIPILWAMWNNLLLVVDGIYHHLRYNTGAICPESSRYLVCCSPSFPFPFVSPLILSARIHCRLTYCTARQPNSGSALMTTVTTCRHIASGWSCRAYSTASLFAYVILCLKRQTTHQELASIYCTNVRNEKLLRYR